jgi:RNA polymerase sigma factor (sigma-70 family)
MDLSGRFVNKSGNNVNENGDEGLIVSTVCMNKPGGTDGCGENDPGIRYENDLVRRARQGSNAALEELVKLHQAWLFNVILRMIPDFHEAEDLCQEVMIKAVTKLSGYRGDSRFRTWLYRIAINHVVSAKRRRVESATRKSIKTVKNDEVLEAFLSHELPDMKLVPSDVAMSAEEVRIKCMLGMLVCLNRMQRTVFILGSVFRVNCRIGSRILDMSEKNYRKILSRARKKIDNFLFDRCGMINPSKPCRCKRIANVRLAKGLLDPAGLESSREKAKNIREVVVTAKNELNEIIARCAPLHRDQLFFDAGATEKIFSVLQSSRLLDA